MELDRQICFPIYAASRGIARKYAPLLKPLGLTYTQYIVMLVIWENGRISQRDLGTKLSLDSGTLTPLLTKLEKRGLILRVRNKYDDRMRDIILTESGQILRVKAKRIPKRMRSRLNLSPREEYELLSVLEKILRRTNNR